MKRKTKKPMPYRKHRITNDWVANEAWDCNVIMELVDIRNIDGTRIPFLKKFGSVDKILTIANKSDLATPELLNICAEKGMLAISARDPNRKKMRETVLNAIMGKSQRKQIKVTIFGYPNVGKSTLINLLANGKKANVSPVAFTTKGKQHIRLNDRVMLVDLPGIYPKKQDKVTLLFKGAVNVQGVADPEQFFIDLFERKFPDREFVAWLKSAFEIEFDEKNEEIGPFEILEKIAFRRGFLLKGGLPDMPTAARLVLAKLSQAPFAV